MTISKWVKEFLSEGRLSVHQQGTHAKRKCFLNDADVKKMVLEEIRRTKPAERSLTVIEKYIHEVLVPSLLGVSVNKSSISEATVSKYRHEWGYAYRKNQKMIYFDAHEREDVVSYRNKWSLKMLSYMEKTGFYAGENEEEVMEPVLNFGEKKLVFVTHDKSTFYANDGKRDLWLLEGENYIRKKGSGSSIMVSEFQCPCHGTIKIEGWPSRTLFKVGDSKEGWCTSKNNMVDELKENAIGLFEALHPGCTAVFLFDNSSNHAAFADDALVASRMTLNEKPWSLSEKYQFRDTVYKSKTSGELISQSLFYEKEIKSVNNKKDA